MQQKPQNPQKINIRHLTESQYKKQKNIPSQEVPKKCQPDLDQPNNLIMLPKPQVSLPNYSSHQQNQSRQVTATTTNNVQTISSVSRTTRTLSFNSSFNPNSSQQMTSLPHRAPLLTSQSSQGNLANPLMQSGSLLQHQRNASVNSSQVLPENSSRGQICNSAHHATLAQQNEELMQSNKELRTQLIQERDTSKQLYETLQKAQVEIKNKESQMNNFIEQRRIELSQNYEKEIQSYKEILLQQERELKNLQESQSQKANDREYTDKLEEKCAIFSQELERLKMFLNEKNAMNSKLEEKCAIFTQEIERLQLLSQHNLKNQKINEQTSTSEMTRIQESIYVLEQEKITMIQDNTKLVEENQRLIQLNNKLEERVAGFTSEIERLNLMLQTRQNQYEERITNMTVEIERLNAMLQSRQNSSDERVVNMTIEIERLNLMLQSRSSHDEEKIVKLTTEIQHLLEVKNNLIAENTNSQNDLRNNYENKIVQLTTEIQRLHELIKQRDEQLADSEETVKRSKHSHKDVLDQERANFELIQGKQNHRIIELENERQYSQMEIQRLQERLSDAQMERDKAQSAELYLNREIENLQCMNNSKVHEIEQLQERIRILEREGEQRVSEMKNHFEMMKQSHISREVQELTIKFNSERKQFETQLSNAQQINKEQEHNLLIITAETDRLRTLCDKKTQEIENLKQTELLQSHKIDNLTIQIQKLNADLADSQKQYVLIQEELHRSFERQKQLEIEQVERDLKREFGEQLGQLNAKLSDSQTRNENSLMKIVFISAELERIKDQNEKLWEDNCILQQREKQIEIEFQEEFISYKVEIEKANREKLESELKTIYEKIETQQQQYGDEINKYQNELKSAQQEIQNLQSNNTTLENRLVLIATENNRLTLINQERERIISTLEIEINNLREKIIQIENKLDMAQSEIDHLEKKVQQYDHYLKERDQVISNQNADIQRQLIQIVLLSSALEGLGEESNELKKQNKRLIEEVIPNFERIINQNKNETVILIQEKTEYYQKVIETNNTQFQNILENLENKQVSALEKYVLSCSELERQVMRSEELEQDIGDLQANQVQLEQNHQQEIQQFTTILNDMRGHLKSLQEENTALKDKLQNLNENNNNLYNEYQNIQVNYNILLGNFNQLAEEKKQIEEELSQEQDRVKHSKKSNDDQIHQLQQNLNLLQQNLENTLANLHETQNELKNLQTDYDNLTEDFNQLSQENQSNLREKEDLEKEKQQLILIIQDLEIQYKNLNEDYRNLEIQLQESNKNYENMLRERQQTEAQLNQDKQDLIQQLEQIEQEFSELKEENTKYQQQCYYLEGQNQQLMNEQNQLVEQLERLKGQCNDLIENLQEKDEEIKRSHKQNKDIQEEYQKAQQQSMNEEKENQLRFQQEITTISIRYEETISHLQEEKTNYEKEIEGYENIIQLLENNIEALTQERQQLLDQAQERMKQLEEWRQKYNGVGGEDNEKLLSEIEEQRQKIHDLEDKLIQKTELNGSLQITINKNSQEIKLLEEEKAQYVETLRNRTQENDKKSKEVLEMRDKINQLNEQIRQLEADLIKKSETSSSHDPMKSSQSQSRPGSAIKAKYSQMFSRNPLEQKDSNTSTSLKNKSIDLSTYGKITTVVTTTSITSSLNKENVQSSEISDEILNH